MILGLGTFGTGTALLYLDVNPLLLILTDTVVGVGMLFAAGSISMEDLGIAGKGTPGEANQGSARSGPASGLAGPAAPRGLLASLGRMGGSLKPAFGILGKRKEEKVPEKQKIDLMLDSSLVGGQSRRILSLAEGQMVSPEAAAPAMPVPVPDQDPFQDASATDIPAQLLEEVSPDEGGPEALAEVPAGPRIQVPDGVQSISLPQPGEEEKADTQVDTLKLTDGGIGADDLLSALRLEAMKDKKKDDASLLRDLKGVKVTGRQLLDELDDVVKEMKSR
jgi:hypothetical protein